MLTPVSQDRQDVDADELSKLSEHASGIGYEVVEIAGALDTIEAESQDVITSLADVRGSVQRILAANEGVETAASAVRDRAGDTQDTLGALDEEVQRTIPAMKELASWVKTLSERVEKVSEMLADVRKSNDLISSIASQVNILAINAKIEAARAGDAGRGFAVVAESVNELSGDTALAAREISGQIEHLGAWIESLSRETVVYGKTSHDVYTGAERTDAAVHGVRRNIEATQSDASAIVQHATAVREASSIFGPTFRRIGDGARTTSDHISTARDRLHLLVDRSEAMVQATVKAGGVSDDAKFIERVTRDAAQLGGLLSDAVRRGLITEQALFDQTYDPIPNTDPQQFMAPYTHLTDRLFPGVQEPALDIDPRVVFCAAVDKNGYLPTHNTAFSAPQGDDPVWNAAHSRNRRMFNDRVGLKAGRNTEDFLLQVYRRDMGGGAFKMMKDLSAPIMVNGRHWGGLRLAYAF